VGKPSGVEAISSGKRFGASLIALQRRHYTRSYGYRPGSPHSAANARFQAVKAASRITGEGAQRTLYARAREHGGCEDVMPSPRANDSYE